MTWDGQPAGEMGAAIEAVIAAAWRAGRDAAAGVCADMSEDRRDIHPDSRTREADELLDAIRALAPPPDLLSTLRPGGASSHPERIAAAAIESAAEREIGQPRGALSGIGKIAVEAISAVELVIVPAGKMARLLEVERKARALLGSEEAMAAALDGDEDRAAMFDPWPEADALVAALREVAA